jgi:hypothetical protein
MTHYDEDVISLVNDGWAVEWSIRTVIDSVGEDVVITQGDDEVVIPWCYIPDIIKALEEARDALERHDRC